MASEAARSRQESVELRKIRFSGRVQGVGFRYTTEQLVRGTELTGSVRNLDNGQVELIVQGTAKEIDQLIQALKNHFRDGIESIEIEVSPATGELEAFHIRH